MECVTSRYTVCWAYAGLTLFMTDRHIWCSIVFPGIPCEISNLKMLLKSIPIKIKKWIHLYVSTILSETIRKKQHTLCKTNKEQFTTVELYLGGLQWIVLMYWMVALFKIGKRETQINQKHNKLVPLHQRLV